MHIIYLAPFDLTLPSGHTSHVLASIRELSRKGHGIVLLAIGFPTDLMKPVKFVHVPSLKIPGLKSVSFGVSSIVMLAKELIRGRTTLFYTRYFKGVSLPLIIARVAGLPSVVEVNADTANERRANRLGYIATRIEENEERFIYYLAGAIIGVTEAVARGISVLEPRARPKVKVVGNGVDTRLYRPLDRTDCVLKHGFHPDRKRIIYAGAFQVWQGVLDLVAAMEIVARHRQDTDLLLVGDGSLRNVIEQRIRAADIQKLVQITSYVPEETVAELVGASDLCVAPYNREAMSHSGSDMDGRGALMRGSPLKLYMYLACGRPVIASHFREAGEYIEANEAGLSVPPENPQELAQAILNLLDNPAKATAMGVRGRQLALDRHDWSRVVDRYLEIANEII